MAPSSRVRKVSRGGGKGIHCLGWVCLPPCPQKCEDHDCPTGGPEPAPDLCRKGQWRKARPAPSMGLPRARPPLKCPRVRIPSATGPLHTHTLSLLSRVGPNTRGPAQPCLRRVPRNFRSCPAAWATGPPLAGGGGPEPVTLHPQDPRAPQVWGAPTWQGKPRIARARPWGQPPNPQCTPTPAAPECCAHRNPCLGPGTVRRSTNKSCFLTGSHLYFSFVPLS